MSELGSAAAVTSSVPPPDGTPGGTTVAGISGGSAAVGEVANEPMGEDSDTSGARSIGPVGAAGAVNSAVMAASVSKARCEVEGSPSSLVGPAGRDAGAAIWRGGGWDARGGGALIERCTGRLAAVTGVGDSDVTGVAIGGEPETSGATSGARESSST